MSVCLAVEFNYVVYAEFLQKLWQHDSANRVHAVDNDLEIGSLYCIEIEDFHLQNHVDVAVFVVGNLGFLAKVVDVVISKVFRFGNCKHVLAFLVGEEFAVAVEELQGVPLLGVVACRDDDSAGSLFQDNSHFSGRRGCHTYIYNFKTKRYQG